MVSNYTYPTQHFMQTPQPGFERNQYNAYMQPSSVQGGPVQKYIKGRPVTCFEEAQGCAIDWDGSLHVFPDLANKRIYTKQVMPDGSCPVKYYVEQQLPQNTPSQANEQPVSNKIIEELQEKVSMLEQRLKGLNNEPKSNATVPNVRTA